MIVKNFPYVVGVKIPGGHNLETFNRWLLENLNHEDYFLDEVLASSYYPHDPKKINVYFHRESDAVFFKLKWRLND